MTYMLPKFELGEYSAFLHGLAEYDIEYLQYMRTKQKSRKHWKKD